ncbi:MAG: DUF2877 domain-containing protein [Leptolinea sp.]
MRKVFDAIQIGGLAKQAVNAGMSGKVVGVTSKGIFLNSGDKILFLTDTTYKSPFNIQVRQMELLSETLFLGDDCSLSTNSITFPQNQIVIDLQLAEIWLLTKPPEINNTLTTQAERIDRIVQRMCEINPNKGWLFLANCGGSEPARLNSADDRIKKNTMAFTKSFKVLNLPGCLASAKSIIGLGGGLTPSGDDWLTGFMLLLARVGQIDLIKQQFVINLGKSLVEMANQKTTTISTNRIEAACSGWAEELFLDLVDHVFAAEKNFRETKIEALMGFGHSSGVDTCMGIFDAWSTSSLE